MRSWAHFIVRGGRGQITRRPGAPGAHRRGTADEQHHAGRDREQDDVSETGNATHDHRPETRARVAVLSGSLPPGFPADGYASLVRLCREAGAAVILDADSESLRLALGAGPDLVKPNRAELADATGSEDVADGVEALRALGGRDVLVSAGPDGLTWYAADGTAVRARLDGSLDGNPTGAGDAVVAALAAGLAVLVVRLLEDYLVIPRLLGDAVGLTPLVVLVAVTACGLLFGGFAVILAIPLAAVIATLIDVIVRDKDPAEEDVPAVIFSAKDAEAS